MVMATAGEQAFQMCVNVRQIHAYSYPPLAFGMTLSLESSRLPKRP
jgi:hypothetical protein